jgi:hypothetical protein
VALVRERYRPSERRLPVKLVLTFAGVGCHVVSVTDLSGRILGFLDWGRYFSFQVAPTDAEKQVFHLHSLFLSQRSPMFRPFFNLFPSHLLSSVNYAYPPAYFFPTLFFLYFYTGNTQTNGAVSKFDKTFISHPTRSQHELSAAGTVHVSHVLQQFASHAYCGAAGRAAKMATQH